MRCQSGSWWRLRWWHWGRDAEHMLDFTPHAPQVRAQGLETVAAGRPSFDPLRHHEPEHEIKQDADALQQGKNDEAETHPHGVYAEALCQARADTAHDPLFAPIEPLIARLLHLHLSSRAPSHGAYRAATLTSTELFPTSIGVSRTLPITRVWPRSRPPDTGIRRRARCPRGPPAPGHVQARLRRARPRLLPRRTWPPTHRPEPHGRRRWRAR